MHLLGADDDWLQGAYQMETQNSRKARPDPSSASHKICWARDPQAWYNTEFRSGPTKCPIGYIFVFGTGPVGLKFACHTMVTSKYQHQIFATTTLDAIPDLVVTSEYFILEFLFSLNNFGPNVLDGRIWEVRTRRKQSL